MPRFFLKQLQYEELICCPYRSPLPLTSLPHPEPYVRVLKERYGLYKDSDEQFPTLQPPPQKKRKIKHFVVRHVSRSIG
ncbi:hypothetical protein GDO78_006627 [Eleutherodactylus coqui]|uniref:Uncharacterized protein n=1 Tax=Eleutherodactylus coqui TaxID=57060 RepID=A0A8J6FE75_ELECQ|nr:hypothetical protein GDO78_006627 [Eleutherodactylus coqui]